jgi:hypothetical protein
MDATVIYPHQLFEESPAVADGRRIYLVEEPLILTHNPIHRQKLMFHKLTLDAYERLLREAGHEVERLTIAEHPKTENIFARLTRDGVERMHLVDTTDDYLEQAIAKCGIERVWYETPLFLLAKHDAIQRFTDSNRFMASFYKAVRKDLDILMDGEKPHGGKWSFDEDNRQKIPKGTERPEDIRHFGNAETTAAEEWAAGVPAEQYGEPGCWLPYTHAGAEEFLQEFLRARVSVRQPTSRLTVLLRWHARRPLFSCCRLSVPEVTDVFRALGAFRDLLAVVLIEAPLAAMRFLAVHQYVEVLPHCFVEAGHETVTVSETLYCVVFRKEEERGFVPHAFDTTLRNRLFQIVVGGINEVHPFHAVAREAGKDILGLRVFRDGEALDFVTRLPEESFVRIKRQFVEHQLLSVDGIVRQDERFFHQVDTPAVCDGRRLFEQLMRVDDRCVHVFPVYRFPIA